MGIMKAEFTAIIELASDRGFWAICPEVPGANGQGETIEQAKKNLRGAIALILEDRKAETLEVLADVEAGRVVEGEKVVDWLDSWGSEDELAPPR